MNITEPTTAEDDGTVVAEDNAGIVYSMPEAGPGGLLRVDTRRLLEGMFVAELDRPWSDTPLPQNGLLIDSADVLQAVRHYCRFVMVDPVRSSSELLAAIRAAAVLSTDPGLAGDDVWSPAGGAGQGSDPTGHDAQPSARRTAPIRRPGGAEPEPRADVHPSEAARARVLRLVREGERAPSAPGGTLAQVRRWFGMGRRSQQPGDSPNTEVQRHRAALQALRDTWGDAIGQCEYAEEPPIRESIALARPVHARLATAASTAIRQIRQETAPALEPLMQAADAFAASVAAAPDAMHWLDAVYTNNAAAPNPAIGVALRLAEFGRALGMPHASLRELTLIGLLADVGKALLPRALIDHPGVLRPSDFALMKQHVTIGLDILSRSNQLPEAVARGIAEHHERLDGSGYPRGLRAGAIGLYGRMAGIVDSFCALTAARAYANPLSAEEALSALHEWSDALFCRDLVEQFILACGAFPIGSLVELQTGEIAAVVERRSGNRLLPRLVVITAPDKGPLRQRSDATQEGDPSRPRPAVRIARGLPMGAFGLRLKDYYLASS
jgi:HD-GYP domain-containing protein (c-di-GMP phosphodiesterase class II)